jgi:hypothetical protein
VGVVFWLQQVTCGRYIARSNICFQGSFSISLLVQDNFSPMIGVQISLEKNDGLVRSSTHARVASYSPFDDVNNAVSNVHAHLPKNLVFWWIGLNRRE